MGALKLDNEMLSDIVRSGVLAPSADNQHVFRYELAKDSINLWPNPEFEATTEYHRRILGLISLGAVVENMCLHAGRLGLSTDVQWWPPHSDGEGLFARLTFHQATPTEDDLAIAIPDRQTNRRMYSGPELSKKEVADLVGEIDPSSGVRLLWLQGDSRRLALRLLWRAESERFHRENLHKEIFSSIRFDLTWKESANWALPPGALEIETPMRPLFKALRRWSLMRFLNLFGVNYLVGARAALIPCWNASSLAVLTTTLPLEQGAVAVGAALERVWLRATRLNLAMQPLAASVVLPLRDSTVNGAPERFSSFLLNGWREIAPGTTPLMVFRIGRAQRPAVRSGRRPLSEYQRT